MASFYLLKNIVGGFEMIEIGRVEEMDKVSHLPKEVQEKILEVVEILANEYGEGYIAFYLLINNYCFFICF